MVLYWAHVFLGVIIEGGRGGGLFLVIFALVMQEVQE